MGTFKHKDEHADLKRREALFIRFRDEILRESSNAAALGRARDRVLSKREVQQDSILANMLRNFAAERIAALNAAHRPAEIHATPGSFSPRPRPAEPPPRPSTAMQQAREALVNLERQFDDYLAHYYEAEARAALGRIVELSSEHPGLIPPHRIDEHQQRLDGCAQRRRRLESDIDQLAADAETCAERGDHAATTAALKRLSSLHAAHPQILGDLRFQQIRDRIMRAGQKHEHREAIRKLLERERAVAGELRKLSAIVHRFHKVARTTPHDHEEYGRAEAAYHHAVREVKSHDAEWLAALILELVDLLADDPAAGPQVQSQIDRFVASVRSALANLRGEIQQIESELHQ